MVISHRERFMAAVHLEEPDMVPAPLDFGVENP